MKKILILLLIVLSACSANDDGFLNIRLQNVSSYDFKNIIINTSTGNVSFKHLNSGQYSDYQVFDLAYRYAFVELEIDGKTYTIQPIDYVGETPLEDGDYTYRINANDSQEQYGRLNITLVED